jgi:hypothetical protein
MQLFMVDQIELDIMSQESHAGRLATVWNTSVNLRLIILKNQDKKAEQLDTCSAQSTAKLFVDVTFYIQNFVGNGS